MGLNFGCPNCWETPCRCSGGEIGILEQRVKQLTARLTAAERVVKAIGGDIGRLREALDDYDAAVAEQEGT